MLCYLKAQMLALAAKVLAFSRLKLSGWYWRSRTGQLLTFGFQF